MRRLGRTSRITGTEAMIRGGGLPASAAAEAMVGAMNSSMVRGPARYGRVPLAISPATRSARGPIAPTYIKELIQSLHDCAQLAVDAGFDGIELHSANGYLVDTFLQDGTNERTDAHGGSIANRARLPLDLTETLVDVFGPGRVGVRVSPSGTWGSISDSDPQATFGYFAEQLNGFPLAYLHVIEPRVRGVETVSETADPVASAFLRRHFNGPIIAAGGFDGPGASKIIDEGSADVVAFGRLFASNPDLPERIRNDWPLAPYDRSAFWGGTEFHYSDYPPYDPAATPHSATCAA
jgi:N-ethylmaleimide reductase